MPVARWQAGKLEATEYVRTKYGFSLETTLACGDSGNDILMLSGESLAVVVGNAQPDLQQWADERVRQEGAQERLCIAAKHEAFGILEALEKFGFN